MLSTVIAPAGGIYISVRFTAMSIIKTAVSAAIVSGSPHFILRIYLETEPAKAQPVISRTVFNGFNLALLHGLENSVNATRRGGETANLKSSEIAAYAIKLMHITLKTVSIISFLEFNITGTYSSFSLIPDFISSLLKNIIMAVSRKAETGYMKLVVCIMTGRTIAEISGAKVVPENINKICEMIKAITIFI